MATRPSSFGISEFLFSFQLLDSMLELKDQLLLLLILLLEHLELLPDRVEAVLDSLSSTNLFDWCRMIIAAHQSGGELILLLLRLSNEGLRLSKDGLCLDGIASEECGRFALGLFFLRLRIERGLINLLFHSYLKMIFSLIMIAYIARE